MIKLRIREILDQQGHTKYWLRKQLNDMSYTNLSNLVSNNVRSIRLETIDKISKVLGVEPGDLFERTDDEHDNISER